MFQVCLHAIFSLKPDTLLQIVSKKSRRPFEDHLLYKEAKEGHLRETVMDLKVLLLWSHNLVASASIVAAHQWGLSSLRDLAG